MTEHKSFVTRVMSVLLGWKALTQALESVLVDNVAATVPWLAPVLPAYLAYVGLTSPEALNMPVPIGFIGAAVVEFLGMATVTTTVQFWDYNDQADGRRREAKGKAKGKQKTKNKKVAGRAPVMVAGGATAFYMVVVLVVNVLLDSNPDIIHKIAKTLLSSISLVGAVTLAVRSQHSRRLADKAQAKVERTEAAAKKNEQAAAQQLKLIEKEIEKMKLSVNLPKVTESGDPKNKFPETYGRWNDWRRVPLEHKQRIARMTWEQVMDEYGVEERTARNWANNALEDPQVGQIAQLQQEMTEAVEGTSMEAEVMA